MILTFILNLFSDSQHLSNPTGVSQGTISGERARERKRAVGRGRTCTGPREHCLLRSGLDLPTMGCVLTGGLVDRRRRGGVQNAENSA